MFLEVLKNDKYFNSLFSKMPCDNIYEVHNIDFDFQLNRLRLTIHSSLIPEKMKNQKDNFSNIQIDFFFISNFKMNAKKIDVTKLDFFFQSELKKIEAYRDNELLISYNYEVVKLENWKTYQNDI